MVKETVTLEGRRSPENKALGGLWRSWLCLKAGREASSGRKPARVHGGWIVGREREKERSGERGWERERRAAWLYRSNP